MCVGSYIKVYPQLLDVDVSRRAIIEKNENIPVGCGFAQKKTSGFKWALPVMKAKAQQTPGSMPSLATWRFTPPCAVAVQSRLSSALLVAPLIAFSGCTRRSSGAELAGRLAAPGEEEGLGAQGAPSHVIPDAPRDVKLVLFV